MAKSKATKRLRLMRLLHDMEWELRRTSGVLEGSATVASLLQCVGEEDWRCALAELAASGCDWQRALAYLDCQHIYMRKRISIVYSLVLDLDKSLIVLHSFDYSPKFLNNKLAGFPMTRSGSLIVNARSANDLGKVAKQTYPIHGQSSQKAKCESL